MKVADNLHRHNISNEFEFQQDCTIHFGVQKKQTNKQTNKTTYDYYWPFQGGASDEARLSDLNTCLFQSVIVDIWRYTMT